jgi:1,4-alpha-glucan branching enzyme
MSLKKTYLKSKPVCKVTFNFPKEYYPSAKSVEVAGTFTDWQPVKMRKIKEGFTRTFDLPVSTEQHFRYRIDGELWENDHEADRYVNTGVDLEENSVVQV